MHNGDTSLGRRVPQVGLAIAIAVALVLVMPVARASEAGARTLATAWLLQQQRGDGSWARSDGRLAVIATAGAVEALARAGLGRSPSFAAGAGWMANADGDSIDSIARRTLSLAAAGLGASAQREADRLFALRSESASATWGAYGGNGLDLIDTALGLAALRVADAGYGAKLAAGAGNTILGAQCALLAARVTVAVGQRAWPAARGATGQAQGSGRPSVIATALVLEESLAIQQRSGWTSVNCGSGPVTFAVVHDEARTWLLAQQNADGGFGEQRSDGSRGPSNVVVTAIAIQGLAALPSPPASLSSARAWLLAQQETTGAWRADPLVTAMALAALPVASGTDLVDADRDGLTDVVEARLGTNPLVADASSLLKAPTGAVGGETTASFAAQGTVGQPFSVDLGSGSGYGLASGSLPPGLSLQAGSGVVSGVPTQAGSWSFDFQASAAGSELVIGRIDIAPSNLPASEGDVPLPPWALALLGAGLAGALWRRGRRATSEHGGA